MLAEIVAYGIVGVLCLLVIVAAVILVFTLKIAAKVVKGE